MANDIHYYNIFIISLQCSLRTYSITTMSDNLKQRNKNSKEVAGRTQSKEPIDNEHPAYEVQSKKY